MALVAAVLGLAGASAWSDPRGNDDGLPGIQRLRDRVAWIEGLGCDGVIGDYWETYPYFALSEGKVLATPVEAQYVRSRALALETVRVDKLCLHPLQAGPCPETLVEFGAQRQLLDETKEGVGSQFPRVCSYARVPP